MFKASPSITQEQNDFEILEKSDKSLANSITFVVQSKIEVETAITKKRENFYVLVFRSGVQYINLTELEKALSKYAGSILGVWVEYERKILCISVKYYTGTSAHEDVEEAPRRTVKAHTGNKKLAALTSQQLEGMEYIKDKVVLNCIKSLLGRVIQHQIEVASLKKVKLTLKHVNAKSIDVSVHNHSHRLDVTEMFRKLSIWVGKQPSVSNYVVHVDIENRSVKLCIDIDPVIQEVHNKRKHEEDVERNVKPRLV